MDIDCRNTDQQEIQRHLDDNTPKEGLCGNGHQPKALQSARHRLIQSNKDHTYRRNLQQLPPLGGVGVDQAIDWLGQYDQANGAGENKQDRHAHGCFYPADSCPFSSRCQ